MLTLQDDQSHLVIVQLALVSLQLHCSICRRSLTLKVHYPIQGFFHNNTTNGVSDKNWTCVGSFADFCLATRPRWHCLLEDVRINTLCHLYRCYIGVPYRIRTGVLNLKGWGPWPLDERDCLVGDVGIEPTYLVSKTSICSNRFIPNIGVPDTIRTCGLILRRNALYPAELQGLCQLTVWICLVLPHGYDPCRSSPSSQSPG